MRTDLSTTLAPFAPVTEVADGFVVGSPEEAVFVPKTLAPWNGRGITRRGSNRAASARLALRVWEALTRAEGRGGVAWNDFMSLEEYDSTGRTLTPEGALMGEVLAAEACAFSDDPRIHQQWLYGGREGDAALVYPERLWVFVRPDGSVQWIGLKRDSDGPLVWTAEVVVSVYQAAASQAVAA